MPDAEIARGPNIGEVPDGAPLPASLPAQVAIKVGDKITTDHIMPAGARLKFRSNVPVYAKYVFEPVDPTFHDRCLANKAAGVGNVIVAGESYGQGSSREHAALCPMYLGVRAVMEKKNSNVVAIVTMFFMFAMISFVTNMAAPFGNIWKNNYEWSGMLGNLMNFLAYLIMGIPAGKLMSRIGYKKTALIALGVGFVGMLVQYLSSLVGASVATFSVGGQPVMLNFVIYLLGAFICGFCVCMLNTVVNPMLNLLGGGGNRGNQLIQTGGTLNSLTGTLTPLLVGALIGTVTERTAMSDVAPLLFIAMGVFALAFLIICCVKFVEPNLGKIKPEGKDKYSAWSFRHLVLGVVAIFFYVGIEVGIPAELNFYLTDDPLCGAAIGGAVAAIYWLLMMVGRAPAPPSAAKSPPRHSSPLSPCWPSSSSLWPSSCPTPSGSPCPATAWPMALPCSRCPSAPSSSSSAASAPPSCGAASSTSASRASAATPSRPPASS